MNQRRKFLKTSLLLTPIFAFPKLSIGNLGQQKAKVLIIGDSISIGYTPFVKKLLNFYADVVRPTKENGNAENCQGTTNGLLHINRWIGNTKWDVIHFNFGLHDIKHVDPITKENSKNPDHPQQANLKQYKKNLTAIIEVLIATGAKLIFATTTPYPDNVEGPLRKPGMPAKYNQAATKIMNKNGITINNLHAFIKPRLSELQKPKNVHFTPEGSKALAEKVADRIEEALLEN
jgi:lysophospholipase L1-like esterase